MAYPAEFLATVVEAGNMVAEQFQGDVALIDRVYRDFSNQPGAQGDTVNIVFPGAITVSDDAEQPATLQALASTKQALTLQYQPSAAFKVNDWTQLRANPVQVAQQYVQPAMVALTRYACDKVAALITAANFATHTPIASVTARTLTLAQIRDARIALHAAKVPVNDVANMSLVCYPECYDRMLADSSFRSHDVVGIHQAESVQNRAVIMPQYAAQVLSDHSMPVLDDTTDKLVNFYFHKYAIGAAIRPLEIPQGTSTKGSYINHKGILIRAMFDYSIKDRAWILSFDYALGLVVLRSSCGVLIYANVS